MNKLTTTALVLGVMAAGAAGTASARDHVSLGLNFGVPAYPAYAPAYPAYYDPYYYPPAYRPGASVYIGPDYYYGPRWRHWHDGYRHHGGYHHHWH
jgi:hypothetical protein